MSNLYSSFYSDGYVDALRNRPQSLPNVQPDADEYIRGYTEAEKEMRIYAEDAIQTH
jgi:hypothetical protein